MDPLYHEMNLETESISSTTSNNKTIGHNGPTGEQKKIGIMDPLI